VPAARGIGVLLAATGLAWYAGNLDPVALYWHRGPLVHLLLTYPGWRPRTRLTGVGVVVGYLAALGLAWRTDLVSVTLSLALVAVLIRLRSTTAGRARHHRTAALQAGLALAAALVIGGAARLTVPGGEAVLPALWIYEAVLCAVAVGLCVGAQRRPVPAVTDLVVELGETRSGTVRDALAQTLGDPSLQIGYWRPATGDYVDATGAQVVVPDGAGDRSVRHIEREGHPYAVLIHDPAILGDATLVQAVEAATRLSASNEALHSEVRARVAEVVAFSAAARRRDRRGATAPRRAAPRRPAAAASPDPREPADRRGRQRR